MGSPKEHLQDLALQIFDLRIKLDLMIIPCWVRREEYEFADASSKCRDTDNWSIDAESILYIQQRFGMSIDRFPDDKNTKLPRFDARFHCPGAETVNTFTANWANEFNWWSPLPPILLIGDTLKHAGKCWASRVLLMAVVVFLAPYEA